MTNSEFNNRLTKRLNALTANGIIDFSVEICKRLFPEYVIFSNKHNWGDPEILKKAIEFCEQTNLDLQLDTAIIKDFIVQIASITPDTEDFGNFDGS